MYSPYCIEAERLKVENYGPVSSVDRKMLWAVIKEQVTGYLESNVVLLY